MTVMSLIFEVVASVVAIFGMSLMVGFALAWILEVALIILSLVWSGVQCAKHYIKGGD